MTLIPSTALRLGLAVALAMLLCHAPARAAPPEEDADFQPGKDWQLPGTGFHFGGYATLSLQDGDDAPASLSLEHASLFVHWEGDGRFRFFSEIDLQSLVTIEKGSEPAYPQAYPSLQRLYVDYLYSDRLSFRLGKFLTPIGRWNVIHEDPLVWTTTRPLVSEQAFPTNTTGAMAFGSLLLLGRPVDYSIYAALPDDWRTVPAEQPFEEATGVHVSTPITGTAEIGVSAVSFVQRGTAGEQKLVGLDYLWSRNRYEIMAEAIYRLSSEGGAASERGAFVQAVAPVSERLYLVGRYEFYEEAQPAPPLNILLAGVAFKYSRALIFKAEFTHVSNERALIPEGFFTSMAVSF
jgi:hypothetical protein